MPPYHIAGISAILTSVYGGRRLVHLPSFSPDDWVFIARREKITHAMVVPTMLGRILDVLDLPRGDGRGLPSLRHLSYGGGRMPVPVIERALALLPQVDFVNAYGLTETSSSIAVLTPDDHREAMASERSAPCDGGSARSAGRCRPLEIAIRGRDGEAVAPSSSARSGCAANRSRASTSARTASGPSEGWFPTRDGGYFDDADISTSKAGSTTSSCAAARTSRPARSRTCCSNIPPCAECAVVGVRDEEWGEVVAAVVVLHEGCRRRRAGLERLRRVASPLVAAPGDHRHSQSLPVSDTGKVLKRVLRDELAAQQQQATS